MARQHTKAERKASVLEQLRDPLTCNNTDAAISRFCGVTPAFVKQLRQQTEAEGTAFQKGTYHEIEIDRLRLDGGTQPRAHLDEAVGREYRDDIKKGAVFPPISVIYDGSDYWVWDGFHRIWAHAKAGRKTIQCEVRQGTRRDAVLLAVGANSFHGLRRTNEDKRRAVLHLLEDPEWQGWSDNEIARRCGVSQPFVGSVRQEFAPSTYNRYKCGADGRVTNTTNIGHDSSSNGKPSPSATTEGTQAPPMRDPVVVDHRIKIVLTSDVDADVAAMVEGYPITQLRILLQRILSQIGHATSSDRDSAEYATSASEETVQRTIDAIRSHGPLSRKEIGERCNFSKDTALRAVNVAIESGRIARVGGSSLPVKFAAVP